MGLARQYRLKLSGRLFGLLLLLAVIGSNVTPTRASAVQTVWVKFGKGAEYTWMPYFNSEKHVSLGNVFVARVAPYAAIFRIYYHPEHRQTIHDWSVELPGAALIVNTSFFDGAGRPMGLVKIGDDMLSAATSDPESGLFSDANEVPEVLPVVKIPKTVKGYSENLESYPVLIANGQLAHFNDNPTDRARRTVIAQDGAGNILIILTSAAELSLTETANWLHDSGLGLVTALNMDGGSSSELHISAPGDFSQLIEGNASVPVVLAVFFR